MKNGVFLFVCLFLLITGYVALADEDKYVYTFQDLFTILDASNYSFEHKAPEQVTIQIQQDIALKKEIVVPREMKNLTLYLNGYTIDGNNNYSFLRLTHQETDEPFSLYILNDDSHTKLYTYDDDNYALSFDSDKMGVIKNCKATRNGGAVIRCEQAGYYNFTLENISFENCEADEDGVVVYIFGESATLKASGCKFINNRSNEGSGGVLRLQLPCENDISYCLFKDNECIDAYYSLGGGAISFGNVPGEGSLTIKNSEFINNYCASYGGAIQQSESGKIIINHCSFKENKASKGGAVYLEDSVDAIISDSIFDDNKAILDEDDYYGDGGALHISTPNYDKDAKIVINNSSFDGNLAENWGGAIYIGPSDERIIIFEMNGSSINGNKAQNAGGGIWIEDYSQAFISDSSIMNNESISGGGIYLYDEASLTLTNGEIKNNTAESLGGGILMQGGEKATFSLSGTDISGNKAIQKYGQDILLVNDSVITISGNLGTNVYDVAKYRAGMHHPGVITSGLTNYGTIDNFKSSEGYTVLLNSNKNAVLGFKVTLNTNGGIINSGNVTGYIVGTETVLPTDVTKKGQMFLGWYDNSELAGEPITRISDSETGNRQYWAKWKEGQYSIVFRNDDGKVLKTYAVDAGMIPEYTGETPAKPADEKYTYAFSGWIPEITAASDDATYTATYTRTPRTYAVILNPNGGTINSGNVTNYVYGTETLLPTDVRRAWCIFVGWYDNSECKGSPITVISDTETGDKEFWARWVEIFKLPDTGDKSNIWFWIGTVLLGMAGITILARRRKWFGAELCRTLFSFLKIRN